MTHGQKAWKVESDKPLQTRTPTCNQEGGTLDRRAGGGFRWSGLTLFDCCDQTWSKHGSHQAVLLLMKSAGSWKPLPAPGRKDTRSVERHNTIPFGTLTSIIVYQDPSRKVHTSQWYSMEIRRDTFNYIYFHILVMYFTTFLFILYILRTVVHYTSHIHITSIKRGTNRGLFPRKPSWPRSLIFEGKRMRP